MSGEANPILEQDRPTDFKLIKQGLKQFRTIDDRRAGMWVALDVSGLIASFVLASGAGFGFVGTVASAVCGLFVLRLFVLGHDAGHGALFSSPRANAVVGRILMLPSLVSYSLWRAGHNLGHHGFTSLATGKGDRIWRPMSRDAYSAAPGRVRCWERCKRHVLGIGWCYCFEVWARDLVVPRGKARPSTVADMVLVVGFAVVWPIASVALADAGGATGIEGFVLGVAMPFAIWLNAMSWIIYLHHTHPKTPWFDDFGEWKHSTGARGAWVLTTVTGKLDALFHNILLHPAHHIDSRIPFYNLPAANAYLVAHGCSFVRQALTPRLAWPIAASCKLYDFGRHTWMTFR